MDLGLQGQVVLVTGAGQGLGREIGLASPLSGWITGQVISVNGGYGMP